LMIDMLFMSFSILSSVSGKVPRLCGSIIESDELGLA
jgi:hypothetical protein